MSKPKYITEKAANAALPPETAEKFEIVNWGTKRNSLKFFQAGAGEVDLRKLSIARATQLVKRKCSFIKEKEAKKSPSSSKADK